MTYLLITSLPLLVSIVMLFVTAMALSKQNDKPIRRLFVWNIAVMMLYCGHFIYFNHFTSIIPVSDTIYAAMNLLVYPLYLIYISEITDRTPLSSKPNFLWVAFGIPSITVVAIGSTYLAMNAGTRLEFISNYLYQRQDSPIEGIILLQKWLHIVCHTIFAFQVIFVITAGFRRIRRFNKTIRQLYADTDHREIKYIPTLLLIFILTSMLSAIVNFIGRQFFVDSLIVALPSIGFSALLAALIWLGTKHRFTIHDIPQDQEDETIDSDTKADSVPTAQSAQIYIKLENIMNEQQTFLQQDVLLNDVARLLGTNRTYLLRALSSCAHMTFKEYVNRKRIAHAEQLIASNPTIPKSEVATLSGYNSLSSFYRNYNTYKKKNR